MAGPAYLLPLPSPHLSLSLLQARLVIVAGPAYSFLYPIHTSLSPFYRPGLSLWQVPPISFLFLLHTSLFFFILQARLVIVAGPAYLLISSLHLFFLSLSLLGPACHCGRSRLFTLPLLIPPPPFLPFPPPSYRPGLSLWQVPPISGFYLL